VPAVPTGGEYDMKDFKWIRYDRGDKRHVAALIYTGDRYLSLCGICSFGLPASGEEEPCKTCLKIEVKRHRLEEGE